MASSQNNNQFNIILPIGDAQPSIKNAIGTWAHNIDNETDPLWQPQMTAGYEFSFYFFGPPFWISTIVAYGGKNSWQDFGVEFPLAALSVPEGIQFGENRPVQTIDAIGTTRRLSKSKYMGGGWGASRIIFRGSNLEYWAYQFILDSSMSIRKGYDPLNPDTWNNAGDDYAIRYSGSNYNGKDNYRINTLVSKLFNYPFGILEIFATPSGEFIEGTYYENCHIQSQSHSVAPGGPIIMRNVSGTFQSAVPVDESEVDLGYVAPQS